MAFTRKAWYILKYAIDPLDQVNRGRVGRSYSSDLQQNIGNTELSYLLYEGEGPPLIFLHATGFRHWLWHPLARELASAYRIIVPSFCEHRETDPESGGLSWTTLAEDTVRLCSALRLKNLSL